MGLSPLKSRGRGCWLLPVLSFQKVAHFSLRRRRRSLLDPLFSLLATRPKPLARPPLAGKAASEHCEKYVLGQAFCHPTVVADAPKSLGSSAQTGSRLPSLWPRTGGGCPSGSSSPHHDPLSMIAACPEIRGPATICLVPIELSHPRGTWADRGRTGQPPAPSSRLVVAARIEASSAAAPWRRDGTSPPRSMASPRVEVRAGPRQPHSRCLPRSLGRTGQLQAIEIRQLRASATMQCV